jgi:hypothetical protein
MKSINQISVMCIAGTLTALGCLMGGGVLSGCIMHPENPAATQPATVLDLSTTQPSYWLEQPAEATVSAADFDRLWKASEQTARDHLFQLDREDFRSGELTTLPLVSAQWFEPWRRDVRTLHEIEESSIATVRRTIYFNFTRNPDQTYTVAPKVLVERQAIAERRITAVVDYTSLFNSTRDVNAQQKGTLESDLGFILPPRYWYVLGRDPAFEKVLAEDVGKNLDKR